MGLDGDKCVFLVFLDLSSIFYMLGHTHHVWHGWPCPSAISDMVDHTHLPHLAWLTIPSSPAMPKVADWYGQPYCNNIMCPACQRSSSTRFISKSLFFSFFQYSVTSNAWRTSALPTSKVPLRSEMTMLYKLLLLLLLLFLEHTTY